MRVKFDQARENSKIERMLFLAKGLGICQNKATAY